MRAIWHAADVEVARDFQRRMHHVPHHESNEEGGGKERHVYLQDGHGMSWLPHIQPPLSFKWTKEDDGCISLRFDFFGCRALKDWRSVRCALYLKEAGSPADEKAAVVAVLKSFSPSRFLDSAAADNDEDEEAEYVAEASALSSTHSVRTAPGGVRGAVAVEIRIQKLLPSKKYSLELALDRTLTSSLVESHMQFFQAGERTEKGREREFDWWFRRARRPSSREERKKEKEKEKRALLSFAFKGALSLNPVKPAAVEAVSVVETSPSLPPPSSTSLSPSASAPPASLPLLLSPGTSKKDSKGKKEAEKREPVKTLEEYLHRVETSKRRLAALYSSATPSPPSPSSSSSKLRLLFSRPGRPIDGNGSLRCSLLVSWSPSPSDLPSRTLYEVHRRFLLLLFPLEEGKEEGGGGGDEAMFIGDWRTVVAADRFTAQRQHRRTEYTDHFLLSSSSSSSGGEGEAEMAEEVRAMAAPLIGRRLVELLQQGGEEVLSAKMVAAVQYRVRAVNSAGRGAFCSACPDLPVVVAQLWLERAQLLREGRGDRASVVLKQQAAVITSMMARRRMKEEEVEEEVAEEAKEVQTVEVGARERIEEEEVGGIGEARTFDLWLKKLEELSPLK